MTYMERKPTMKKELALWNGLLRNAQMVGDDATVALAQAELEALDDEKRYWRLKALGCEDAYRAG